MSKSAGYIPRNTGEENVEILWTDEFTEDEVPEYIETENSAYTLRGFEQGETGVKAKYEAIKIDQPNYGENSTTEISVDELEQDKSDCEIVELISGRKKLVR